jgi:hypothetical protein
MSRTEVDIMFNVDVQVGDIEPGVLRTVGPCICIDFLHRMLWNL